MKKDLRFSKRARTAIKFILLSLFILGVSNHPVRAQKRTLVYDVMRNGNVIGEITFVECIQNGKKYLRLVSDVKTKYIFSFTDHAIETAEFENDVMVYSSYYQKQNGADKARKMTIAAGNNYNLVSEGVSKVTALNPIRYNMLLLYSNVPEKIYKVYSDNYQKLLDIEKVSDNKYKLRLPDGNCNYYTYKNNVCSKVDIERAFFTAQFVLREK